MVSPLLAEGLDQGVNVTLPPHRHTRGQLDTGRETAFLDATPPGGAAYRELAKNGGEAVEFFSRFRFVRGHSCFRKALQYPPNPIVQLLHWQDILATIPRFFPGTWALSLDRWLLKTSLVRWRGLWRFSPFEGLGMIAVFVELCK